jgi:hypothetical protein
MTWNDENEAISRLKSTTWDLQFDISSIAIDAACRCLCPVDCPLMARVAWRFCQS